ncbi:hypothetical protein [Nocardiopsis nanhaiensis]
MSCSRTLATAALGLLLTTCGGNEVVQLEPPSPAPPPTAEPDPSPDEGDD